MCTVQRYPAEGLRGLVGQACTLLLFGADAARGVGDTFFVLTKLCGVSAVPSHLNTGFTHLTELPCHHLAPPSWAPVARLAPASTPFPPVYRQVLWLESQVGSALVTEQAHPLSLA